MLLLLTMHDPENNIVAVVTMHYPTKQCASAVYVLHSCIFANYHVGPEKRCLRAILSLSGGTNAIWQECGLHILVLIRYMLSCLLTLIVTMQGCDAVLALRGKIKAGGWLRTAAKGFAVPIFSVKTSSPDHLTRAVQTILGLEPSPGGLFGASRAGSVEPASSSNSESQQGVCKLHV